MLPVLFLKLAGKQAGKASIPVPYSSFSACKKANLFVHLCFFFFNCSTINTFRLGSLCLKVFFSCNIVINTYAVILLSWFLFFIFLISISSHFIEYTLRNKNSSKLLLASDTLNFCLIFFFSPLVCNSSNRQQGILKKGKIVSCKITF